MKTADWEPDAAGTKSAVRKREQRYAKQKRAPWEMNVSQRRELRGGWMDGWMNGWMDAFGGYLSSRCRLLGRRANGKSLRETSNTVCPPTTSSWAVLATLGRKIQSPTASPVNNKRENNNSSTIHRLFQHCVRKEEYDFFPSWNRNY